MWGSEFFSKTLIILLLLFDVREQLLIRKKSFPNFKNRTCYENVTERFIYKLRKRFLGLYICLFTLSTTQKKVFDK